MNSQTSPSFIMQAFAIMKRRLRQYIKQPRDIMLNINPVIFLFTLIIIVNTIFTFMISQIEKQAEQAGYPIDDNQEKQILDVRD